MKYNIPKILCNHIYFQIRNRIRSIKQFVIMENSPPRKRPREELKKEDIIRFIQDRSVVIEKPNDKRSSIWKKFGHPQLKESGEVLKNFAICSVCSKTYHYDAKSGNTTLNAHKCVAVEQSSILKFTTKKSNNEKSVKKLPP